MMKSAKGCQRLLVSYPLPMQDYFSFHQFLGKSFGMDSKQLTRSRECLFSKLEGYDPSVSDILLTDLTEKLLYDDIAKLLGVSYLADTQKPYAKEVSGIIYGKNERLLISLVVEIKNKRKDVIFIVDTGSPFTYISRNVLDSMGYEAGGGNVVGKINGEKFILQISPKFTEENKTSNFHELNILGMVFLRQCLADISVNLGSDAFIIKFN